jgi:hypothetical protein
MANQPGGWIYGPPRRPMPGPVKDEVDTKAEALIEKVLKPKNVQPPPKKPRLNYITKITTKWLGSKCYFISTYACPDPHALSPIFESKFARLEYVGNSKFALSFMRHTGQWVVLYERLSVDECMKAIEDDPWFQP